jgi:heterodisulfide reductase subunit A
MKKKIGVYICACGGNISDYVDIEKVKQAVEGEDEVFLAKTTMFACGDSNQNDMSNDIKTEDLNGIIVASCSPKLHLQTFRSVCERSGLNKYNYVHANIREQDSWAHSDDKIGATEKAILLVKAAIAKARLAESLEPFTIDAQKAVAVVGAGIAGLKAAISLSKMGTSVYLIEKEHYVGGRVQNINKVSPENESGKNLITRLYEEVKKLDNITLFTGAEIVEQNGNIGDFKLKINIMPRLFSKEFSNDEIIKAIECCPQEVLDSANGDIIKRKAIESNFIEKHPSLPSINNSVCSKCGDCKSVCSSIDLDQKEELINLHVGSLLIASGFDSYEPTLGEFGYTTIQNVITLPQFKTLLDKSAQKLVYNNKEIRNIAYIYCVGSRQIKGDNKYCSRYCCTANMQTSIEAKAKFPNIQNFHFTRGVRTYGKQELVYAESLKQGDLFIQVPDKVEPIIEQIGKNIRIQAQDILSAKKSVETEVDLVVLVTGMIPSKNTAIGTLLKLPKGRDHFFNEIHMKLRPVETVIDGITIAGACQGPKNVMESVNSALSAAAKSHSYVSKGAIELEPIVAYIDKDACTWCEACSEACPYSAILKNNDNEKPFASINNSVCKGCGMCLPVCPSNAIQLTAFSDKEMECMIDELAK